MCHHIGRKQFRAVCLQQIPKCDEAMRGPRAEVARGPQSTYSHSSSRVNTWTQRVQRVFDGLGSSGCHQGSCYFVFKLPASQCCSTGACTSMPKENRRRESFVGGQIRGSVCSCLHQWPGSMLDAFSKVPYPLERSHFLCSLLPFISTIAP